MKKSKYWQTALLLNLLFLFSCFVPTQIVAQTTVGKKLTPREIAQQTLPSTVLLVMGNSSTKKIKSGSGFFVAEDIVATNFHVIKDTTEGYAKIYGQEKIYKILGTVGIDERNDLALLKLSGIKGKPLKLNTDDSIAIGDEVFAVGNPEGLEGTFSQGIVSSIRKTDKFNLLQITASISKGSSGGAVLNDRGEVVGVAVGAIESGQSLNFAIPASFLRSLISNQKPLIALKDNAKITDNKAQSKSKNKLEQPNSTLGQDSQSVVVIYSSRPYKRIIELRNIFSREGDDGCAKFNFTGRIIEVKYYENEISGIRILLGKSDRFYMNKEDSKYFSDRIKDGYVDGKYVNIEYSIESRMTKANRNYLKTLFKKGNRVRVWVMACGATGRFWVLDRIKILN